MEKLTFEQLPEAVAMLLEKIGRIEKLLSGDLKEQTALRDMLTTDEAVKFLDVSYSKFYKMSSNREIPIYKPGGKKMYVKRDDLVGWVLKNRINSNAEIEKEALEYVMRNPKKY